MIKVAAIGVGYWGPNLVRNLAALENVSVTVVCDINALRAETIRQRFCPGARVVADYRELAADPEVDAVVIITPIVTHCELGSFFLAAGKHVLIEKPMARTVAECEQMIRLAEVNQRVLMVGHVFRFNLAVQRIKQYVDQGDLGKLFYIYSQRVNLGRIQQDINALWSFAPHDISIINFWLGEEPVQVSARGFSYLNRGIEDVVFLELNYPSGVGAHMHLGWLDPRKVRLMTLVGSRKMVVYDDISVDAKIQVYDKSIDKLEEYLDDPESFAQFQFQIKTGDLVIPTVPFGEPLQAECRHFIECIDQGKRPLTDGWDGLRVVKVLEAAEQSLLQNGAPVSLPTVSGV